MRDCPTAVWLHTSSTTKQQRMKAPPDSSKRERGWDCDVQVFTHRHISVPLTKATQTIALLFLSLPPTCKHTHRMWREERSYNRTMEMQMFSSVQLQRNKKLKWNSKNEKHYSVQNPWRILPYLVYYANASAQKLGMPTYAWPRVACPCMAAAGGFSQKLYACALLIIDGWVTQRGPR